MGLTCEASILVLHRGRPRQAGSTTHHAPRGMCGTTGRREGCQLEASVPGHEAGSQVGAPGPGALSPFLPHDRKREKMPARWPSTIQLGSVATSGRFALRHPDGRIRSGVLAARAAA